MSDKGKMTERLAQAWAKITKGWTTPLKLMIFLAIALTAFLVYWGCKGFVSEDIDQRGAAFRNFGLPILAVWGICLAVWRSLIAQKQADTAAQQANTAAQQANTATQQANTAVRSLQNDRYQRGAEMLGSSEFPVRVGGVQALAQLARDEPETYYRQIMGLFASFVFHPTPDDSLKHALEELPENQHRCRPDIEAIVQIIGTRTKQQLGLDHPAAHLATGETLAASIELKKADLRGALLQNANLSGLSFFDVNFYKANLIRANLTNATLESVNFTRAILSEANLTNANLGDANLTNALLYSANLSNAILYPANLTNANLRRANLTNVCILDANFANASLEGANLTDADFDDANTKNLKQVQLDRACQNPEGGPPNLPDGFRWNEEEAIERWKKVNK